MAIATINPATGQTVQTFIAHSQVEVNAKLDLAQETFQSFRHLPFAQRGQWLRKAADILEQRRDEWAALMTLEMGKSIPQAIAEVNKCALVCRFYADKAEEYLADEVVTTDASQSFHCLPAPGGNFGGDALEFPLLAGVSFCGPSSDGR